MTQRCKVNEMSTESSKNKTWLEGKATCKEKTEIAIKRDLQKKKTERVRSRKPRTCRGENLSWR